MSGQQAESPISPRSIRVALAVSVALAWSTQSGPIVRSLLELPALPYLRSAVASLSDLLVMILLVALAARRSLPAIVSTCGLERLRPLHLAWALGTFGPVLMVCLVIAPLAPGLDAAAFAWPGVLGPILEELVYRGLAVGILMRICNWRLLPACVWPALFFGLAHLWQGSDGVEAASVVVITGLGGLLFGWLFVRWGFSLWPPITMHVGMNSIWIAFDFGTNAAGGLLGNGQRAAVVLLGITLSLWLTRKKRALER